MKVHKTCLVESVASKDATRQAITHAYLEGNTLTATNGIAMVRVPIEREEHDVDGYVTKEALKAARKAAGRLDSAIIQANGSLSLSNGQIFPRPQQGDTGSKWPNCDQVWNPCFAREVKFRISFNAEILADLAAAMGTEGVTLEITGETDPIRVKPCNTRKVRVAQPDARGILCSIRTT